MDNEKFFYKLLEETKAVFERSPVYKFQKEHAKNWNYAVCETPIQQNKGLVFGLNWGGNDIGAQTKYPRFNKERNWNFMSSSAAYFRDYLNVNNIEEVNYSNLCFFRSPKIKDLKTEDWELSLPLFKKYVEFVNPTWTVLLGKKGISILNNRGLLSDLKRVEKKGAKNRSFGYTGLLFGSYPFYCVPHPQARIESVVREAIWNDLFEMKK